MTEKQKYIKDYHKCLEDLLICFQSQSGNITAKISKTRDSFFNVSRNCSGYWTPIINSIDRLEFLVQNDFTAPFVRAGIQQLYIVSKLCIGTYVNSTDTIPDLTRTEYCIKSYEKSTNNVSAMFVFYAKEDLLNNEDKITHFINNGAEVICVLLGDAFETDQSSMMFKLVFLPRKYVTIGFLFDAAFFATTSEFFVFCTNPQYPLVTINKALNALIENSSLASVMLDNEFDTSGKIVFNTATVNIDGIYRRESVMQIGTFDCLFSDNSYICMDYEIRTNKLDYMNGIIGTCCEKSQYKLKNCIIERDEEAMLRKYGVKIPEKLDKKFIIEYFNQFSSSLEKCMDITLLFYNDNRFAQLLKQLINTSMNGMDDVNVSISDMTKLKNKSDMLIFCFPVCQLSSFGSIIYDFSSIVTAKKLIFYDMNLLFGDNVESSLSDKMFSGVNCDAESLTVFGRKKMRDKLSLLGFDVSFTRITESISANIRTNLTKIFPNSVDAIIKNVQTKYYVYVCTRNEVL